MPLTPEPTPAPAPEVYTRPDLFNDALHITRAMTQAMARDLEADRLVGVPLATQEEQQEEQQDEAEETQEDKEEILTAPEGHHPALNNNGAINCNWCFAKPAVVSLTRGGYRTGSHLCLACATSLYPRLDPNRDPKANRSLIIWNPPDHKGVHNSVGIEIEGNWYPDALFSWLELGWAVKNDGSLRGCACAEIVSPVMHPLEYAETIRKSPLDTIIVNKRCGAHIWIGVPDLTWAGVNKIMYYASLHESKFAALVPPWRTPSATPDAAGRPASIRNWRRYLYENKAGFLESLYGLSGDRLCHVGKNGRKGVSRMGHSKRANDRDAAHYPGPIHRSWWLNVHGYWHRKAIEVRLLHSTASKEVLVAWIEMWMRLFNVIPTLSLKDLRNPPSYYMPPLSRRLLSEAVYYYNTPGVWKEPDTFRDMSLLISKSNHAKGLKTNV